MTIDELIAALEKAEGPSREIDAHIAVLQNDGTHYDSPGNIRHLGCGSISSTTLRVKHYTASLDAALTLVPDGCDWFVSSEFNGKQWFATVTSGDRLNHFEARESRASPAIAICIVALKARRSA